MLWWWLTMGAMLPAAARDPAGPLAVPVAPPWDPAQGREPGEAEAPQAVLRPRIPLALPDAERLAAIRAYRSRRLAVHDLGDLDARGVDAYTREWGPWGPSWSWMWVPSPGSAADGAWGIVQGDALLDVPSALAVLAHPSGAVLERRIRALRTTSTLAYTVGVVGLATSVVGIAAVDRAEAPVDSLRWTAVTASGVGLLLSGVVGGTLPAARANRLQFDPTATFEPDGLEDAVDAYNAQLVDDLGI